MCIDHSLALFHHLQNVTKLPHMVVQQYIAEESAAASAKHNLAALNAQLAAHKNGASTASAAVDTSAVDSALAKAIAAVRALPGAAENVPAGTVLLTRGGEFLGEGSAGSEVGAVNDGQQVNVWAYPALAPLLPARKAQVDGEATARSENGDTAPTTSSKEDPSVSSKDNSTGLIEHDFVSDLRQIQTRPARRHVHLIVLQHGFLGMGYDMQLIENSLRLDLSHRVEVSLSLPML
jgi:hypothetical protein